MTNTSNNTKVFYKSIADVYDHIFPLKKPAFAFTKSLINKTSKILDAGCATGSMSIALSPFCAMIDAFDIDTEMIRIARQKSEGIRNINFVEGDMLKITDQFHDQKYDLIVCYGNTLVHLLSIQEISTFLHQAFELLNPGGQIAIQILNYNYILDNKINMLPIIINDHIVFTRKYQLYPNHRIIDFNTELKIKEYKKTIKNTAKLLAIRPEELKSLLIQKGFRKIKIYSSFKKSPLNKNKLPLIIHAEK
jgi:2-polyprenyl-3-methyl-5-hydroxy-6-metoxy-1,4-benzoquinol methylase